MSKWWNKLSLYEVGLQNHLEFLYCCPKYDGRESEQTCESVGEEDRNRKEKEKEEKERDFREQYLDILLNMHLAYNNFENKDVQQ